MRCEQTDGRVNGREYHGLVYFATDDSGNTIASPFKASRLGKFASRTAVDNRFERAKDKIDIRPTKRMVTDAMVAGAGKEDFIAKLKERNIDLVLRYTDNGRIYGATFIDHNTMTVLNGSPMGREFSANALESWFNGDGQKPIVESRAPEVDQTQSNGRPNNQDQNVLTPILNQGQSQLQGQADPGTQSG